MDLAFWWTVVLIGVGWGLVRWGERRGHQRALADVAHVAYARGGYQVPPLRERQLEVAEVMDAARAIEGRAALAEADAAVEAANYGGSD